MSVVINGSAGVTTNSGAVYNGIAAGTAVTASGQTSIDFTSIPSWVKRVTVMFQGVSLSGTDEFLIQVGTGSTPATTGYNSAATSIAVNAASTTSGSVSNTTNGFSVAGYGNTAASLNYGQFVLTKVTGNSWSGSGLIYATSALRTCMFIGGVDLASALEMVRITTTGTDTFDAGSINILYE